MALNDPHLTSPDEPENVATRAEAPPTSDAELLAGGELLPCGRPLGRAWEQARDLAGAADPHSSSCPYCQEAVEGLAALDRATRALRAEEQPDSHSLANRVINAVRAEVRLGAMLLLDDPDRDLRIAESAAAKVLRRAADTVLGARAASCRLTPVQGGHSVAITVAAALDKPLRERAEKVRQAVFYAAEHTLGLAVTVVDLEINAVLERPHVPGGERFEPSER
ncbi:hypothetical protein PV721_23385 [Streptomyces sp. MB09-01]|uniref:hypothetical protein n=1 Tax=Streptomyces sp. MB09-01 TaxID=3028666 RepID=UPI0029B7CFFA|nr:hypothetical protein [Streptomyces sp. MB09-01]MDX3537264.1 hypothetical protein [Streptomyces sp. MB09-01]